MNGKKFEKFILKKMKEMETFHWELLHETGPKMIKKIVEDEDQGPFKKSVLLDDIIILLFWTLIRQIWVK